MTAPTPIIQSSVNISLAHRTTRGGRNLIYRLAVIQQPERARACGAGNKAQADRRPVDPPPVVELRIFEGVLDGSDPKDSKTAKDITFEYSANFVLFTTLEHARAMAHGRVQHAAATMPPVLTGMPVSGMAYLDRPHEAGYFLFPDLSIRHEGRYRLNFNLFEQTKHEADFDVDMDEDAAKIATIEPSFDHRMDIKSAAFSVYSAKKFPGLQESTALSKVVADQGCRVRIRREVRMRKREEKQSHDDRKDEYAPSAGVPVARASATPDRFRGRSMSNSSEQSAAPPLAGYPADGQRRPSGQDYQMSQGYLQFGNNKTSSQFAQPSFPASAAASSQQQQQQQQQQQPQQQPPPLSYHRHHHHQPPPPPMTSHRHAPPISPAPPSASPYQRHAQSPFPPPAQPPYHAPSPSPVPYGNSSSSSSSSYSNNRPILPPYAPSSRTITPSHDGYDRRPSMHNYTAPSPSTYNSSNSMDHDSYDHRPSQSYSAPGYTQPAPRPYQMLPPAAMLDQPQNGNNQYTGSYRQYSSQQALPPISTLSEYKSASPRPTTPVSSLPPMPSLNFTWHSNTISDQIEAADGEPNELPKPLSPHRAGSKRKLGSVFTTNDTTSLHNGKRQEDDHHAPRPSWHATVNGTEDHRLGRLNLPFKPAPGEHIHDYVMTYPRANGTVASRVGYSILN